MQYNRDSIEGILDSYEKFKEHVENVLQSAGKSNSTTDRVSSCCSI